MEIQKNEVTNTKVTHFVYPYLCTEGEGYYDLMYSIRSLYKYFKGDFDVTLVGDKPNYYNGKYIPRIHVPKYSPQVNTLILFDTIADIYDEFIVINDDMILINDCTKSDFTKQYHINNDLNGFDNPNIELIDSFYTTTLLNAYTLLKSEKKPTKSFSAHVPHFIESKKLKTLISKFDLLGHEAKEQGGVPLDTLYNNYFMNRKNVLLADSIRIGIWDKVEFSKLNFNKKMLNFNELGFKRNPELAKYVFNKFIQKSPLEK